jgi:hypothetical protein
MMLCGFCAVACGASKPQSTVPTVNDILARYVTALGGRAAISKISSRVSKGTFEIVGVEAQGTAESYAKAPNKYLSIITLPGYGEIRRCFDGQIGWLKNPETGLAALVGQDLSSTRRSSDIYQAIELSELYPQMSLKGQQDVDGWPAYVIEAKPGDGTLRRMYFDVSSGLLIRNDEEEDTPQGRDLNESYLSDYHEIDGVKIPFTVKQVHGHTTAIVHLTDVRVNQPIDDAVFSKPTQ